MLRLDGNTLVLSGPVTVETYRELRSSAAAHVGAADLVIDWSGVEDVDSSAVALILSWQRDAARGKVSIAQVGLPESLTSLVELYSLTAIVLPAGGR